MRPGDKEKAGKLTDEQRTKFCSVSFHQYPADVYPVFAQGNGYFLSADLALLVGRLSEKPWLRGRWIADDIMTALTVSSGATGASLNTMGIDTVFAPDNGACVCRESALFYFDLSVESIRKLHGNFLDGKGYCGTGLEMCGGR